MLKILAIVMTLFLLNNCTTFANSDQKRMVIQKKTNTSKPTAGFIKQLRKGKTFKSQNEAYVFLPDLVAVLDNGKNNINKQSSQSSPAIAPIYEKGRFNIYNNSDQVILKSLSIEKSSSFGVVYNERTRQYGILTGKISVRFEDINAANNLETIFNIKVSKQFRHIKIIFYEIGVNDDIIAVATGIRNHLPNAEVSIDVLEHVMVPQ